MERFDPDRVAVRSAHFIGGQYVAGTTFAEGLVWFHDRWLLYYGCADSRVGVAMSAVAEGR